MTIDFSGFTMILLIDERPSDQDYPAKSVIVWPWSSQDLP
jgi:hypothetical protein